MKLKKRFLLGILAGVSTSLITLGANAVVRDDSSSVTSSKTPAVNIQAKANKASSDKSELFDRLIIKYKETAVSSSQFNVAANVVQQSSQYASMGVSQMRRISTGAHLMRLENEVSNDQLNQIMSDLESDPNVEWVEKDSLKQVLFLPNDPFFDNQWHYFEEAGGLNLPPAWDFSTGEGVVVAVIDTGITDHSDLRGNILPGFDMISNAFIGNDGDGRDSDASDTGDAIAANECGNGNGAQNSSWHGTHVAGTVAALGDNADGVTGVAFNAKVVPIRALGKCGGFTSDIADAIIWAAGGNVAGVPTNPNPADVINLSLGGAGACDATSQAAINQAVSLGATVVVAAGNAAENVTNASPANCQNVISVASVGRSGGRAFYSNFGDLVDLAAPGGDQSTGNADGVLSTLNNGRTAPQDETFGFFQGTSMAAPHVAGAAALLYSLQPNITPAEVESILKSTSRDFPANCNLCGTGIVDAAAAIELLEGGEEVPVEEDGILENGVVQTEIAGVARSETFFTIEVPEGATNLRFQTSGGVGDVDLYVRFGAEATTSQFDCRPFLNGNNEVCNFATPQAGTFHVMLQGFATFSGVNLEASFVEPVEEIEPEARESINESDLAAARRRAVLFTLEVPEGSRELNVNINGGSGDGDLYVRFGSTPTRTTFDCRPFLNGSSESCTIENPEAGTWHIAVDAFSTFEGLNLEATSQ